MGRSHHARIHHTGSNPRSKNTLLLSAPHEGDVSVAWWEIPFPIASFVPNVQHKHDIELYVVRVGFNFNFMCSKSSSSLRVRRTWECKNSLWKTGERISTSIDIFSSDCTPKGVGLRCFLVVSLDCWLNKKSRNNFSNTECKHKYSCMFDVVTLSLRCWTRFEASRILVLCEASDPWVQPTLKPPLHRTWSNQCECDKLVSLWEYFPKPPTSWSSSVSSVSVSVTRWFQSLQQYKSSHEMTW